MKRLTGMINKELIVDVNPYRTIVVLMEDGRAKELHVEQRSEKRLVGNIYRGIVRNVLPGMSAVFVDIGEEKNAILHLRDIRVERTQSGGRKFESLKAGEKLSGALSVGKEIMIQIIKEPLGTKGAKASMEITLPGHTLVLLPTEPSICFSKRFRDDARKVGLRKLLQTHCPEGVGVIARSESEFLDDNRIINDLDTLIEKWNSIEKAFKQSRAPRLIWQEETLTSRAIRDLMRFDVKRLVINDRDECVKVTDICKQIGSDMADKVEFIENEESLIERFNIAKQIDEALSRRVWLKSGAYIIIDRTEALVSIDVNTGKNIGNSDIRRTIFETNREAAIEIAHQIRLRNLGGIIVVDFIDMDNQQDREELVKVLKDAMANDQARPTVYGMTQLGLVEIARRRLGNSLDMMFQTECSCCNGNGRVLSAQTVAMRIRQRLLLKVENGSTRIQVTASPSVIETLREIVNEDKAKGRMGDEIEITYSKDVSIRSVDYDIRSLG